jgi:CheY-like chemotaxis protein
MSPARLLLVEDSADDAYFFRRALRKASIECELVHVVDGGAAVELLRQVGGGSGRMPSGVFLDLKMPVLNGFEVLDWIRQQSFTDRMPVFVLSGSDHEEDKARARSLGASRYLVKPIKPQELKECVASLDVPATSKDRMMHLDAADAGVA